MSIKHAIVAALGMSSLLAISAPQIAVAQSSAVCARTFTIGFSHPHGDAAFVVALRRQVILNAKKHGCVNMLIDNTQLDNLETQRTALESWVTQKVDAIVVLPVDAKALLGLQKQAQKKGIKWLTYAAPTDGADGSVGFDSIESGQLVGQDALEWVKKHYPNGGASAAVTTLPTETAFLGRSKGPIDLFKQAKLPVVSTQECGNTECGLRIAEDALRQNPTLRVFIGFNDDAAMGALRAFTNAKINPDDVYIAGQDGTEEGLAAVKKGGAYRASAAIDLSKLAQAIVNNSVAAATGESGSNDQVGTVLATGRDVAGIDRLIAQYKE
ncbi:sugar ABC transporter substrate-binding protein [Lichenihabitans sp. Uapishka_5]|uniref:sugar ABC transporter substrate-binding protein n=1 Tax=Lichenihabitans sp. Uapishka_5 TaxID=3037302 RepID=UPI0029E7E88D|nr:sugar ABC transporter substrate-binding protein [Lichenihabitans sp. Uapishka_5]MDX7951380.1 sugar ABC transporter substrate-binding protein [Lichenihabitans sp. Uapishka_5]